MLRQLAAPPRAVAVQGLDRCGSIGIERSLLGTMLLLLAIGLALTQQGAVKQSSRASIPRHGPPPHAGLASLPVSAQGPVSQALGASKPAYRIRAAGKALRATSPAQRLHVRFDRSGVVLTSDGVKLGLNLHAMGYGRSLIAVGQVTPSAKADRVTYTHAGLSEWYANGPLGLEQGFTIPRAPPAPSTGPLTLSITLSHNARASLTHDGRGLVFGHAGAPSLRYTGLTTTDARGRTLHSWLELHGGTMLLRVDARNAHYPLRIDPLIQQAKLTGGGEVCERKYGCRFGFAVALSADGNTALIGGPHDSRGVGAAWVFVREGTTWAQQGPKLTGNEEKQRYGRFGGSVALSADGNTALIGGPGDNGGWGAAWVFTREGKTWVQQGPKLVGSEVDHAFFFGYSVALSADGNTALIGGPEDHGVGAAWVFAREGTTWAQQGPKLTGKEELGEASVGRSVALSADGNTALIGANTDDGGVGAAWVFVREGTTWAQQGPKLTGTEELGVARLGFSVALSADGNTALIGGYSDDGGVGAAWVFAREGTTWAQQTKLTGNEESGLGEFGDSVALSPDANTALIGGHSDDKGNGAAWLFTREGTVWVQRGAKLTAGEELGKSRFGRTVALSADGNTGLIGGSEDGSAAGAAWVFVSALSVTAISPATGPAAGGTTVSITGTNFTGVTAVRFGSTDAASFKVNSPTSITAISPAGSGTVDVTVSTSGSTSASTAADQFGFEAELPPTVTALKPIKGRAAGGTTVTITGANFTGVTAVKFGSVNATSFTVSSAGTIKAISPAETAGTVDITVATTKATSAISSADHYKFGPPTITNLSPTSGSKAGGTSITVTGTGFAPGTSLTTFKIGTASATPVSCASITTCTVVSPAHAVETVDVRATVAAMKTPKVAADQFGYS
jgi:hypothetical protein